MGSPSGEGRVKIHRFVVEEPSIPFEMTTLYEDDHIIVVDKPHFLPTTPRGMWYRSTAQMRLRENPSYADVQPAHRLDRMTAGVVLFVKRREERGAYQTLFQSRHVKKIYECLAPSPQQGMVFPLRRESYIQKDVGVLYAYEKQLPPNAVTLINLKPKDEWTQCDTQAVQSRPGYTIYRLQPLTGKTHQLRVHMSALGIPIANDELYPVVNVRDKEDFSSPLELIARHLSFCDPFTHEERVFTSKIEW